jgi:peptidoglycan/LPS O-acetylase OafA/YrhL
MNAVNPAQSGPASTHLIPSLDGIRALSFMVVFAGHAGFITLVTADFGVTVFFFLSGYLITTLLRNEFERTGSVSVRNFCLRRALRILPPFYIVMSAAMLLALTLYPRGIVAGSTLMAQLLFYANYEGIYGINHEAPGTGVVWSLAVEEHFYLLFPWLYLAMQKLGMSRIAQARLLWCMCALVLAWRCLLVMAMHATSTRIYLATDTRIDAILFGCALALWRNPFLDDPWGSPRLWKISLLPAAFAVLLLSFLLKDAVFRDTVYFSFQGVALTLIFVAAIRFHQWPAFRILNYGAVAFIGVLSYSLYLVHDVILRSVRQLWPNAHGFTRTLVALVASMLAAATIYVLVEKPCAQLRKRLSVRRL